MLGLVAFTVQGLAPLCLAAMMGGRADAPSVASIIICTVHGYQAVQIGADGKPVPNAPTPDQQGSNCPTCGDFQQVSEFTAPPLFTLVVPITTTGELAESISAPALPSKSHFSYISRAPPASAFFGLA